MRAALENYEIAGPVTNIEFLKRCCVSPAFVAGEVETGYIQKHKAELFERREVPKEALAQAAIGLLLEETSVAPPTAESLLGPTFQSRAFHLTETPADGVGEAFHATVEITELPTASDAPGSSRAFSVRINDKPFPQITTTGTTNSFTSYFPHTRLTSTLIRSSTSLSLFQAGSHYKLQLASPKWVEKALGIKEAKDSVLAPMPCKVLRVDVKEGDSVEVGQSLVVIESMKMETVIRSPMKGVVKRVVHGAGVSSLFHFHILVLAMRGKTLMIVCRICVKLVRRLWSLKSRLHLKKAHRELRTSSIFICFDSVPQQHKKDLDSNLASMHSGLCCTIDHTLNTTLPSYTFAGFGGAFVALFSANLLHLTTTNLSSPKTFIVSFKLKYKNFPPSSSTILTSLRCVSPTSPGQLAVRM
jgi:biotin carboxyl carrier protein